MNSYTRKLTLFASILLAPFFTGAQRMPQDNWYLEKSFASSGSGNGQLSGAYGIAIGDSNRIFVADTGNNRIQVFNEEGSFLYKWGATGSASNQFNSPRSIAIGTNGMVYVSDAGNQRIKVFTQNGEFKRMWFCQQPTAVAVNPVNGQVVVADNSGKLTNQQIKIYADDGTGTLVRAWGGSGDLPGQFRTEDIQSIAVDLRQRIVTADGWNSAAISRLQLFDWSGTFLKMNTVTVHPCVSMTPDGLIVAGYKGAYSWSAFGLKFFNEDFDLMSSLSYAVWGLTSDLTGNIYAIIDGAKILKFKRSFRTAQDGGMPVPSVINAVQRPGSTYVDIDYEVIDSDSSVVTVGALAFSGGTNSLKNVMRLNTLVEGTDSNLGPNITANRQHRITWNAAADWTVDYGDAKFRILANDGRELLGHVFITMPANETNSSLTIARDPVTQNDLLHCWYWLIATNDAAINVVSGKVYGVGGSYNGVMLASNTTTTASGRALLFSRMGVREATTAELSYMRNGFSGVTNQWIPRLQIGPGERPKAVNELGFDTGNWGADGWWVVKE